MLPVVLLVLLVLRHHYADGAPCGDMCREGCGDGDDSDAPVVVEEGGGRGRKGSQKRCSSSSRGTELPEGEKVLLEELKMEEVPGTDLPPSSLVGDHQNNTDLLNEKAFVVLF